MTVSKYLLEKSSFSGPLLLPVSTGFSGPVPLPVNTQGETQREEVKEERTHVRRSVEIKE